MNLEKNYNNFYSEFRSTAIKKSAMQQERGYEIQNYSLIPLK